MSDTSLDYVQEIKRTRAAGESLAAILEGIGQVVFDEESETKAPATRKVYREIRALLWKAHAIARKEGL